MADVEVYRGKRDLIFLTVVVLCRLIIYRRATRASIIIGQRTTRVILIGYSENHCYIPRLKEYNIADISRRGT